MSTASCASSQRNLSAGEFIKRIRRKDRGIGGKPMGKGMDAATIANELPKGLYIINGKKVMVK